MASAEEEVVKPRSRSGSGSFRHKKELKRTNTLIKNDGVKKVFGDDLSGVFKFFYHGSCALHTDGEIDAAIATSVEHIKKQKRPKVKVNLAITSDKIGMIEMPSAHIIQNSPLTTVMKCNATKDEIHLVTVNPRIGINFLHVLSGKKEEVSDLPEFIAAKLAEAKEQPGYDASAAEKKKGLRVLGSFDGVLLGNTTVNKRQGQITVAVALANLKKELKKNPARAIEALIISTTDGLRIYDGLTDEEVHVTFIKNISFATVEDEGDSTEIFAYIEEDVRLAVYTAYFFACPKGAPDTICRTVGKARDLLLEEEERKSGNPFLPEDDVVEVTGPCKELEVDRMSLAIIKELGAGQFGTVYLVNQQLGEDSEVMRAVKILRGTSSPADEEMFKREAEIMAVMNHPQIVQLVGVCMTQRPWLVSIELMMYGDVRKVIQAARSKKLLFTFAEQLHWARQVADGMRFIAEKGYVHMDLAARNVLVHENSAIKIADFGCTRAVDPETKEHKLTETLKLAVRWMSHETLRAFPIYFSEKTDVYAYGVFLWELVTYGRLPYGSLDARATRDKIREGMLLPQPTDCPDFLFHLMSRSWAHEPKDRPTFAELQALIDVEYEKARAETGQPRDLGAVVNSQLASNVTRMSKRASVARRASVVDRSKAVEIKEEPQPAPYSTIAPEPIAE